MKKFLVVLFAAAALTACNNSGDTDKTGEDTIKPDSPATTLTPGDSTNLDSLNRADSTRMADSLRK